MSLRKSDKIKKSFLIATSLAVVAGATTGIVMSALSSSTKNEIPDDLTHPRTPIEVNATFLSSLSIPSFQALIDKNSISIDEFNDELSTYVKKIIKLPDLEGLTVNYEERNNGQKVVRLILDPKKAGKEYKFVFPENEQIDTSKYFINDLGTILTVVVTNDPTERLRFYTKYKISNVEVAYKAFMNKLNINGNEYTLEKFKKVYKDDLLVFYDKLGGFDLTTINWKEGISFDETSSKIKIPLIKDYKKYDFLINDEFTDVEFDENTATIFINVSGFYKEISIDVNLLSNIQNFISTNKYTIEEVNNNLDALKDNILNSFTGIKKEDIKIDPINSNNNELIFTIYDENQNYTITNLPAPINVTYSSSMKTINDKNVKVHEFKIINDQYKGLQYYTEQKITNVQEAYNKLQGFITDNEITVEDFVPFRNAIMHEFWDTLLVNDVQFKFKKFVLNFELSNLNKVLIELDSSFNKYSAPEHNNNNNNIKLNFDADKPNIEITLDFYKKQTTNNAINN